MILYGLIFFKIRINKKQSKSNRHVGSSVVSVSSQLVERSPLRSYLNYYGKIPYFIQWRKQYIFLLITVFNIILISILTILHSNNFTNIIDSNTIYKISLWSLLNLVLCFMYLFEFDSWVSYSLFLASSDV